MVCGQWFIVCKAQKGMILHVLDTSPAALRARTHYALKTALSTAGLAHRLVPEIDGTEQGVLCYGRSESDASDAFCRAGGIWIQVHRCDRLYRSPSDSEPFHDLPDSLRYLQWDSQRSSPCPPVPLSPPPPVRLPFWGGDTPTLSFERIGKGLRCILSADLFGNLFLHLSRMEELGCHGRDRFGRFRSSAGLLAKADLLDTPVVDGYLDLLIRIVTECCRRTEAVSVRTAFWPAGERFAAFLSHDVDRVVKWTPKRVGYEMGRALRHGLWIGAGEQQRRFRRMCRSMVRRENPYWNFDLLMDLEGRAGVRSSFYLGVGDEARGDPSDCTSDERVRRVAGDLREGGWEIGLHGSHGSYNKPDLMRQERKRFEEALGCAPSGIRQHFLRLDIPETFRVHADLGFEYDATLGYSDREGFRAGTSLPFSPFDLERNHELELLEIPLSLMDRTLEQRGYDERQAARVIQTYLDSAGRHGGLFSLLVHQSALDEQDHPYTGRLYRSVLAEIDREDVYCRTGEEIARWWRRRASLEILEESREGARWVFRITSPVAIPDVCLILRPLPSSDRLNIEVEGCGCIRQDDGDAVRLHLCGMRAGKAVEVHVSGGSER